MSEPTVECKYCGTPTPMLGTKMCDNCWEMASRIRLVRREVLAKIVAAERSDVELQTRKP